MDALLPEPEDDALAKTPSEAYQHVAGEMMRHTVTWIEDSDDELSINCECGFTAIIEDEEAVPMELSLHRTESIAAVVNNLLSSAWDAGWVEGSEGQFPTMAGIFLNPYRELKANFDVNRTAGA